jgi:hypothetical protein
MACFLFFWILGVGEDATKVPSGEGRGESEEGNWMGEKEC